MNTQTAKFPNSIAQSGLKSGISTIPIKFDQQQQKVKKSITNKNIEAHQELMLGSSKFIVYLQNSEQKKSCNKQIHTIRPKTTPYQLSLGLRNRNLNREKLNTNLKIQFGHKTNDLKHQQSECKSRQNRFRKGNMSNGQKQIDFISRNKQNIMKMNSACRSMNSTKKDKMPHLQTMSNCKLKNDKFQIKNDKVPIRNQKNAFSSRKVDHLQLLSPLRHTNKNSKFKINYQESIRQSSVKQSSRSQISIKQDTMQKIQNQPQIKSPQQIQLNHQQIKNLFGGIHKYYQPKTDYLTQFISKQKSNTTFNQVKQIHQKNCSHITEQCNIQITPIESFSIHNQPNQSYYSFESDRAPILSYLKKTDTKRIYLLMMRQGRNKVAQRFRDQQFPPYYLSQNQKRSNLEYISNNRVFWSYYPPEPQTKIFQYTQGPKKQLMKSIPKYLHLQIISFLCCLISEQQDIIKHLFEPPLHNIYCVWLFTGRQYQPVYIDGYFPLNQQMQHFYGQTNQGLWLSIMIKCICKIIGGYQLQNLRKIDGIKIYQMLTALKVEHVNLSQYEQRESDLCQEIDRKLKRNYTCLLFHNNKRYYKVIKEVKLHNKLCTIDPCFGLKQVVSVFDILRSEIMTIIYVPAHQNRFIYSNRFIHKEMSKMEIRCTKKTQIFIIGGSPLKQANNHHKQESREGYQELIYIYECTYNENKKKQMILKLKFEGNLQKPVRCVLKRGIYKIFFEAGNKKIHQFFQNSQPKQYNPLLQQQNNEKEQKKQDEQYVLTILSSNEIKVSNCEGLEKKGNRVQDKKNLYFDPYHINFSYEQ